MEECDRIEFTLVYANKSEEDILVKDLLDDLKAKGVNVQYVLEHPGEGWTGHTGMLNDDLLEDIIPEPSHSHLVMHCGQPGMNIYVRELLLELGHGEDNVFQY